MQKNQKVILAATFAFVILVGGIAALVLDAFTNVPDFRQMRDQVKVPIYLPNGERSYRWVGPKAPDWVPIRRFANSVLSAVIASEDTTFYIHKGVDYHELQEAIKKDLEEKRWARGASTLTQQLIKNVYLSRQKTLWRKLKEFLWAQALEKVLSKSEILCFYVNMVEWGPGIYGIKAAARHYISAAPSELTPRESAFLAMLLPSPVKYHRYFAKRHMSAWATGRVNRILMVMNSMGFLEDYEYEQAMRERLWGETSVTDGSESEVSEWAPDADFEGGSDSPANANSDGRVWRPSKEPRAHSFQDEPSAEESPKSTDGDDPLGDTPPPQ
jgi:membrane peptidoglycan carboxypeptidase